MFDEAVGLDINCVGCVITLVVVLIQPLASVIVTEYEPTHKPVTGLDVLPFDHSKLYGAVPPTILAFILPSHALKHVTFVGVAVATI